MRCVNGTVLDVLLSLQARRDEGALSCTTSPELTPEETLERCYSILLQHLDPTKRRYYGSIRSGVPQSLET